MKKYIARLCETATIEFTAEQYLKLQNKTITCAGEDIPCKVIVTHNDKGVEYYILFPVSGFEVEDE